MSADGPGLFAWTRQFTGTPWRHRAYVRDRATGEVVWACSHQHRARNGKNGESHAMSCASRQLRRMLGAEGNPTGNGETRFELPIMTGVRYYYQSIGATQDALDGIDRVIARLRFLEEERARLREQVAALQSVDLRPPLAKDGYLLAIKDVLALLAEPGEERR